MQDIVVFTFIAYSCKSHCPASTISSDLRFVPEVNTNIGSRAFSVATLALWKTLPSSVRSVEDIAKFRRHLKTYLYNLAFLL